MVEGMPLQFGATVGAGVVVGTVLGARKETEYKNIDNITISLLLVKTKSYDLKNSIYITDTTVS